MQRLHKTTKKIFDQCSKKMCEITKKSQPVASISRKMTVTLDPNNASLNKRDRSTLCDQKKNQKCQSLCCKCDKYVCLEHPDIVCINCA